MCSVAYVSRHASSGSGGQVSAATTSILGEAIVGVAVQPTFPRLRRCDHGMPGGVGVFRRVPVGRVVAAVRAAALLTRPEVHPLGADLHTLVAHAAPRLLDRRDRGQMRARSSRRHGWPSPPFDPCAKLNTERADMICSRGSAVRLECEGAYGPASRGAVSSAWSGLRSQALFHPAPRRPPANPYRSRD